jgi:hypothetical protein
MHVGNNFDNRLPEKVQRANTVPIEPFRSNRRSGDRTQQPSDAHPARRAPAQIQDRRTIMKQHRALLGIGLMLACVLAGAVLTSAASALPLILVLPGEKAAELKYTGEGGASILEDGGARTIEGTKVKTTATFKAATEKEADTEAGEVAVTFEGTKKGALACRSETTGGIKDPVETILVNAALATASEESTSKTLQGMLVNLLKETLFINCGGVKEEVKGALPCLIAPALTEIAVGGTFEILCAQKGGVQTTGKCLESKATCENLAKNPLLANLGGGVVSAGEQLTVKGTFNKMVLFDD